MMKSNRIIFSLLLQLSVVFAFLLFFAGAAPEPASVLSPSPSPVHTQMSGGLLALLIILAHITIIGLPILIFASMWKIFEKAGESGWKALIPFYNTYVLWKISGAKKWALITSLLASGLGYISNLAINATGADITQAPIGLRLVSGLVGLAALVANVVIDIKLAEAFGKAPAFAVGLILLPTIFFPILAFMDSQYQGGGDKK